MKNIIEAPQIFPPDPAHFFLAGPAGQLEVISTYPKDKKPKAIAIVCHPDPRQEGTMHNKVVTMLAKTFDQLNLATLRFNFRGIGNSEGQYGQTVGESEDLLTVMNWAKQALPDTKIWLAGFSFGSYIAANIANQYPVDRLISIAPPVHHYDFQQLTNINCPWLIIQGQQDEIVPVEAVQTFAQQPPSPLKLVVMDQDVGHFFHGKLIDLRDVLLEELA